MIQATSGLYYKHITIVNYNFSIVKKFGAPLSDDARVIIYDHHMPIFISQFTESVEICQFKNELILSDQGPML